MHKTGGFRFPWSSWAAQPTETVSQHDDSSVDMISRKAKVPKSFLRNCKPIFTSQNENGTAIGILACKFSCIIGAVGQCAF